MIGQHANIDPTIESASRTQNTRARLAELERLIANPDPITSVHTLLPSDVTGISALADVTGLSVDLDVVSGRSYELITESYVEFSAGSGQVAVTIDAVVAAAQLVSGIYDTDSYSVGRRLHLSTIWTATATGTETFKVRAVRMQGTSGGSTLAFRRGNNFPAYLLARAL